MSTGGKPVSEFSKEDRAYWRQRYHEWKQAACTINTMAEKRGKTAGAMVESLERQRIQTRPKPRPLPSFIKELGKQSRTRKPAAVSKEHVASSEEDAEG